MSEVDCVPDASGFGEHLHLHLHREHSPRHAAGDHPEDKQLIDILDRISTRLQALEKTVTAFTDVPAAIDALKSRIEAATARIEAKIAESTGTVDLSGITSDVDALDAVVPAPVVDPAPVDANGNPVTS